MDPLQPLFELYDEMRVQPKPELQDAPPVQDTPGPPADYEHPVIVQRNEVEKLRQQGVEPEDAHQQVYGEIDTGNIDSKAQFASTLGRLRSEKDQKGVRVDKDGESLLAKEREMEKGVTDEKLKTPVSKEINNVDVTTDPQDARETQEVVDAREEYDYNEDVAYLQKYGRA